MFYTISIIIIFNVLFFTTMAMMPLRFMSIYKVMKALSLAMFFILSRVHIKILIGFIYHRWLSRFISWIISSGWWIIIWVSRCSLNIWANNWCLIKNKLVFLLIVLFIFTDSSHINFLWFQIIKNFHIKSK